MARAARARAPVLRLVAQDEPPNQKEDREDTIACLLELLAKAKSGELVGLAFVEVYAKNRFMVDAAGAAWRDPTRARGAVAELSCHLGRLARGE